MTVSRLTEEDFSSTISDLNGVYEVPVLSLSEGDYLVAYGHIEKEEFLGYCNTYTSLFEGSTELFDEDEEVLWTWAKRKHTPGFYPDEWEITWKDVSPDDEDAFPITLVNTW